MASLLAGTFTARLIIQGYLLFPLLSLITYSLMSFCFPSTFPFFPFLYNTRRLFYEIVFFFLIISGFNTRDTQKFAADISSFSCILFSLCPPIGISQITTLHCTELPWLYCLFPRGIDWIWGGGGWSRRGNRCMRWSGLITAKEGGYVARV